MRRDESGKETYNFGTIRIHGRECAELINKYYLYEDIKQDRNVKYDKPKRRKKHV